MAIEPQSDSVSAVDGDDVDSGERKNTGLGPYLGVNVDHVATIRQARQSRYPDPVQAGLVAASAGAHSITVHLREDRRHIQQDDVWALKRSLSVPLNLEMAVLPEMIQLALLVRPEKVCLVPERREELTTEGGLDVVGQLDAVAHACATLSAVGIEVSLFIEPELEQIRAAQRAGADVIELHTGKYADVEGAEA
ncbi:MAG: pyridoxine 5'-phosphate synthase, partial [Gammaproteobacteria bacterium]